MFFPNTEQLTRQVTFIKGAKNTQATLTMVQTILLHIYTRLMLLNDFFLKKRLKKRNPYGAVRIVMSTGPSLKWITQNMLWPFSWDRELKFTE